MFGSEHVITVRGSAIYSVMFIINTLYIHSIFFDVHALPKLKISYVDVHIQIMSELHDINKRGVFDKLDRVRKSADDLSVCNDVIGAISKAKERDKRIINEWGDTYVRVRKVLIGDCVRACRCFTAAGIAKYVHEGRVYSYKNACEYYGVAPVDKEHERLSTELRACRADDATYRTKKILKWLFERRKQDKRLGATITIDALVQWLKTVDDDDYNHDKYDLITAQI